MKKLTCLVMILTAIITQAQSVWKVDQSHSSINFAIAHLVISETTGSFDKFNIEATTEDNFVNPAFNVSIETASINTKNNYRDEHLRAPDFFNAKEHEAITFKSTVYKKLEGNNFSITGNITIKGITKTITFKGKLNGVITDSRSKKKKAGLKLTATIDKDIFDIGKGNVSLGKEVAITIHLEMVKQS